MTPAKASRAEYLRLAAAARKAIAQGADPVLTLSYVVWPTATIAERLAA